MQEMTPEEIRHFLLGTPRTTMLTTVRADGRPHVAPIWFDLDGEVLVISTSPNTVRAKNIRRDPRVSLCVDDPQPPYAYVIIEGVAEITNPSDDQRLYWTTRLSSRYRGDELGKLYGKRYADAGEVPIRITPTKIIAHKGIAD
jgi:PPOX class probable F420-dependent enzyme